MKDEHIMDKLDRIFPSSLATNRLSQGDQVSRRCTNRSCHKYICFDMYSMPFSQQFCFELWCGFGFGDINECMFL